MAPPPRVLIAGLATWLGLRRLGFFLPYRYAHKLPRAGSLSPYPALEALFRLSEPRFREVLGQIEGVAGALAAIGGEPPPAPRWDQDWFPPLDAAAAYALVRALRPRRIVEVGAGHSTRFVARAVRDGGFDSTIIAIDPAPRADLTGLGLTLVRAPVHQAGEEAFAPLAAGDVVMIDSSHLLMPGSDVDFLLNRMLPSLPAGVMVHVHDVFLPDDYPTAWAWRGYNEQLGVAALIQGGAAEIVFASHYALTRMAEAVAAGVVGRLPQTQAALASSLWLRLAHRPA